MDENSSPWQIAYENGYIFGWESYTPGDEKGPYEYPYENDESEDYRDADGNELPWVGEACGKYDGWYGAFWHEQSKREGNTLNTDETYNTFCQRRGHVMKNKFLDKDGSFDEMAFRTHCMTLAQQHAPRGQGVINGIPQQPEPIGEILARAQKIERYLKDGHVDLPQENGAVA